MGFEEIIVRVPASTANLGSGFDSIGVALKLYLTVHVRHGESTRFEWMGEELANASIADEDNLILKGMERVYAIVGKERPPLHVRVESQIPLTRGLGSSASALVAGLLTANELLGNPLRKEELIWLATEEEGHADNVGAALFGGIFIGAVDWDKQKVYYQTHPFPKSWKWIAAIPDYVLSTSKSRGILPKSYTKEDAIFNLSRYGLLAASLISGNREGVAVGLDDRLHQPYRKKLIPGFDKLLENKEKLKAIGIVISGAGPTVLALVERDQDEGEIQSVMKRWMGDQIRVMTLEADQTGAVISRC